MDLKRPNKGTHGSESVGQACDIAYAVTLGVDDTKSLNGEHRGESIVPIL